MIKIRIHLNQQKDNKNVTKKATTKCRILIWIQILIGDKDTMNSIQQVALPSDSDFL